MRLQNYSKRLNSLPSPLVTIQQVVFLYTQWIKSTVKFFNNWKVPIFPKFPYPPTTFYSTRISESSFESNTLKINK